ncbi:MAG: hypothetical protein WCL34_15885 [Methylococcaceae bacterium]
MKAWLVNTNSNPKNKGSHCFEYMIRHNKVAAYYGNNEQIDAIKKNDLILLYHNQNRIIAIGCVVEEFKQPDYQLGKIEHWADVNWLWKASFDKNLKPTNSINRKNVGITKYRNTVEDITKQLNYKLLFEEIAKRQIYM